MKRVFLFGLLLAPLLAVAANDQSLVLGKVVEQQQQIRHDLQAANGKYRGMSSAQQAELIRRQDELFRMFEGKQTAAELTEDQRLTAFNDLEWIEATLNKSDASEQMICTRERTIGSNRVTRVCRTREQMEALREAARKAVDRGDMMMRKGG